MIFLFIAMGGVFVALIFMNEAEPRHGASSIGVTRTIRRSTS